jgi:hypothetical protein
MVVHERFPIAVKKHAVSKAKNAGESNASVTFPPELCDDASTASRRSPRNLEGPTKQERVLIAWLVREVAEKYLADQWPLFYATFLGEK